VGRAAGEGRVGAFLSGGTDSSTITGMLGEVTGESPRAYAIGFDAPGYDETAYARIAARRYDADYHEYFVTPGDVAAAIPRVAAAFDQPFGNASVVPAYYCAKLARDDGVDTLLGGDGGDELFAGNARYAKQWLFSLYERVPAPLRRGLIEPVTALPGARSLPPLRKVARYVEQANMPVPRRLLSWNLLTTVGPERVFTPEFLAAVDQEAPLAAVAEEYERMAAYGLLNRLLAIDMKFTLGDDDLRKVTMAGAMAGVETRFPFLDDEIVALAARVPPGLKLRRRRLRHFFKEALRDYLPQEILDKEKHGFGLPFGEWLRREPELQALARDSLDGLRSRGIVREAMIEELTDTRLEQHAGYFGTLTWVLIMLEQWFRHHGVGEQA
jgi:asparagine synthase (glutamine-hydrolysing)